MRLDDSFQFHHFIDVPNFCVRQSNTETERRSRAQIIPVVWAFGTFRVNISARTFVIPAEVLRGFPGSSRQMPG